MFIVTVDFEIKPNCETAFVEAMNKQAYNSVQNEDGCLQFDVCQDPENPRKIFLYEVYRDSTAFDRHLKTEHFLDFDATVRDWTASKTARQWQRLSA
jgi:(4S)-4-hydroxy-5-phosphonooxypentane-2,3-dione isomerase